MFKGVQQGLHEKIQFAVDEQYLWKLKQPMLSFLGVMPKEMLDHLKDNCTVGMLDVDKLENELNEAWEPEDHINKYQRKMVQRKEKLSQAGIEIRDKQMMIKVMKHMFLCNHFNEMDLTAWKQNLEADKTFNNAVICFKEKYKEKMSF